MSIISRIFTSLTLSIYISSILLWSFIHLSFSAGFTESDSGTFAPFQRQLIGIKQDIEAEFRINESISVATLQNAKRVIQSAYERLPDRGEYQTDNSEAKKWVDLAIDLAIQNPKSQSYASSAVSAIDRFVSQAKIDTIAGNITATPPTGNAPMTVSFAATNINDPSGVSPIPGNHIWWMRENGGYRRELGRGPTLTYSFTQEWNYQIYLDVISGSRNSRWYTDVLPLSIGQNIQVKPKLGEITLLINGVNVSSIEKLKINPTIGKIGVVFDATASRAISNGTIKKTKWDFGNGNTREYNGGPIIERQLYVNQWTYEVILEIETNQGEKFRKLFQLIVIDPSASIGWDKKTGYIGENFDLKAVSYFANPKNTEYTWTVLPTGGNDTRILYSQVWSSFSYKFPKVGEYIVTLTTKNPGGQEDRDSRTITIESREPIVNLDEPKILSPERPNIFVFDASKSFDPDTKSANNLTFRWNIDGNDVSLNNLEKWWSVGTYSFNQKGNHTVKLTVSNAYGKITTVEKTFIVNSTLAVNMNIVPRAAPIGTVVSFQGISPRAAFYEWNPWDGSPAVNGQMDSIDHIYKKTGVYSALLTVKNNDGSEVNSIERKVYVTDANNPFALIEVKNASNTIIDDPIACGPDGAFVVNRSEGTTLDGANSINIDGNTLGLNYTWKYLDRVKTGPILSEKFTELGCFPVELTVKSNTNGASHVSKRYIQIKNLLPKITAISTKIDTTKQDSQKLLVNVTADGARDEDGVITSYIWYYTTESDNEPQNVKITQSPTTTFILPNITEKYTFWVILEDNDGARVNSKEVLRDQVPLLITNDDGNINMPLISLSTAKTQVLAGEKVSFLVSAKTILGTDITTKSTYNWDFDGDGTIDTKTTEPRVDHTYTNAGNYTVKVKVTYNWVSNSKYQNIIVKNELKAKVKGYRSDTAVYLMNVSEWYYDSVLWQVGDIQSDSLHGLTVPREAFDTDISGTRILTINALGSESANTIIDTEMIGDISDTLSGWVYLQSSHTLENDTIRIKNRWEKLLISLYGNVGSTYSIDTNIKIDSDTNGTPDDDSDNINFPSYRDGSIYIIDSSEFKSRSQTLRVTISKSGTPTVSRDITLIAEYVSEKPSDLSDTPTGSGAERFSQRDRDNLEKLQSKIRTLESDDRIILTQDYNTLIENWDDTLERTKKLIDIQEEVINSSGINQNDKDELSTLIDLILVWDASANDEVTVATRVIESLISTENPDRWVIIEKLEMIKSHPGNLELNKWLGSEILELVKNDSSIEDRYKLIIRSQLQVIINGGQASIPEWEEIIPEDPTPGGILGFIKWTVIVFFSILGIIIVIILIGLIIYRFSRKKDDMGFQDFLIDSIFHAKSQESKGSQKSPESYIPKPVESTANAFSDPLQETQKNTPLTDPMSVFGQRSSIPTEITQETSTSSDPLVKSDLTEEQPASIPDWLKPQSALSEKNTWVSTISEEISPESTGSWISSGALPESSTDSYIKDPKLDLNLDLNVDLGTTNTLKDSYTPPTSDLIESEVPGSTDWEALKNTTPETEDDIPEWLRWMQNDDTLETSTLYTADSPASDTIGTTDGEDQSGKDELSRGNTPDLPVETQLVPPASWDLPDWLIDSASSTSTPLPTNNPPEKTQKVPAKRKKTAKSDTSEKTPESPQNKEVPSDLPDWLK